MRMGRRPWFAVVLALAFGAAPALRAQEQPSQPQPPASASPSSPGNPIEAIGNAVRGLFDSIFGGARKREGEIPGAPPPPASPDAQPVSGPVAEPAGAQPQAAPPQRPSVAATPAAAATQSLQGVIAKGDYAAAVKMIEAGANIDAKDPNTGASPLHYAVWQGNMALVALLIDRGADVNSVTKNGATPLHTAVLRQQTEIAEFLIAKGANVNAKTVGGATPLGIAIAANFHAMGQMLRRHGGQ